MWLTKWCADNHRKIIMMRYFTVGGVVLNAYAFCMGAGLLMTLLGMLFLRRKKQENLGNVYYLVMYGFILGFVFGHVLSLFINMDYTQERLKVGATWFGLLTETQAFSFHGAVVGGLLAVWIYAKEYKVPMVKIFDFVALFAPMYYAIGRVGCFLAGCCRGTETQSILGVAFPDEMNPLIFRHPVQLYDSFLNMMLFLFLLEFSQKKKYDGQVFLMFLLFNSAIRFFVEYFRWGVSAQVMFGVITQAQLASLVIIAVSVYFMKKLSQGTETHIGRISETV